MHVTSDAQLAASPATSTINPPASSLPPVEPSILGEEEEVFGMDGEATAAPALTPPSSVYVREAHGGTPSAPSGGEEAGALPCAAAPQPVPAATAPTVSSPGAGGRAWGCAGAKSLSAGGTCCAAACCATSAPEASGLPLALPPCLPTDSPSSLASTPTLSYRAAASAPVPIRAAASPSCSVSPQVGFSVASPRDDEYEQAAGGSWGRCAMASSPPETMSSPIAWPHLMGTSPASSEEKPVARQPASDGVTGAPPEPAPAAAGSGTAERSSSAFAAAASAEIVPLRADNFEGWPEELGCGEDGYEEQEEEGVMCAICHGNIQPNEVALVAGCDHAFCSPCILNWALQKSKCPLCLTGFTHLWLYRRIDGTYNDYLIEESVDLLHCAVWFRKRVSSEFMPAAHDEDEEPDDYHEMLQWMYGGGAERQEDLEYYEGMQDDLERGRPGRSRAFGQRKYGSGGFIAAGGTRLAARIPQPTPPPTFKKKKGFETKKGFEAAGSSCGASGTAGGSGEGADSASSPRSNGKKAAGHRKAEKQAMKDAQKEKRRSWAAGSGAASGAASGSASGI